TVRAPDVVVTTNAIVRANPSGLVAADVPLAVEVMSGGSRRTDRVTKLREYAEAGIADYWIVDLEDRVSLAQSPPGFLPHLSTRRHISETGRRDLLRGHHAP